MIATARTPHVRLPRVPLRLNWSRAGFAVGIATVFVFAHGCHKDDVDHEPSFHDQSRPKITSSAQQPRT